MALFESTWDTPNALNSLSAPMISKKVKKRKRDEGVDISQQNINLDRLMERMAGVEAGKGEGKKQNKGRAKGKGEERSTSRMKEGKGGERDKTRPNQSNESLANRRSGGKKSKRETIEAPSTTLSGTAPSSKPPLQPISPAPRSHSEGMKDSSKHVPSKKRKEQERQEGQAEDRLEPGTGSLTMLQSSMKNNLEGARFRFINEQLYKSSSNDALKMMQQEPQVYAEYHTGFRHQTRSWPINPVTLISASLSSLPPRSLIVDLGCGDAQLAKTLVPEGLNVLSFDLVSDGAWVVEADVCARVPLPGSEDGEDGQAVVDACVCSLSLMSTNWIGCVREAWRVSRIGARFVVAEVTSRFQNTDMFVEVLSDVGFQLVEQTAPSTHFLLFEFRKVVQNGGDINQRWDRISQKAKNVLKPCEYKRR
ncbi:25S rRNA (adenine645-N1)-methyltransferase [Ceratobasidium sp. 428]|nr:25S rRNA (adenine645-N1)-methyltransferase [Ceratobasidium sp. 428]